MKFNDVCSMVNDGLSVKVPDGFAKTVREAVASSDLRMFARWRINAATRNPKQLAKIYAGVLDDAMEAGLCSGEDTEDGFDWNSLLAFIQQLLPVILQIISIFSAI